MTTDAGPDAALVALVSQFFTLEHASVHPMSDDPWIELRVDPADGVLSLSVDAREERVVTPDLATMTVRRLNVGRGSIDRLSVAASIDDWVVIAFFGSVTRALIDGWSLSDAIDQAYRSHRALLESTSSLAAVREAVGLFGELKVLESLFEHLGAEAACVSWIGPDGGEHDYVFENSAFEVKTTLSEQRHHAIGSLRQLEAAPEHELSLVSVRLTDDPHGESVDELVDRLKRAAGAASARFERSIISTPTFAARSSVRTRRFSMRDAPRVFQVGIDFEPLTQTAINSALKDSSSVTEVSYVLDLEGKTGRSIDDSDLFVKKESA